MLSYFYRFVIGFSTLLVVYYVYAAVVVPLIDTQVTQKKIETQYASQASNQRYDKLITEMFPEDDWIRDRCKILDAKQSILFFKDAKQLEDGNWEVKPFTMFLNPDEALVEGGQGQKNEKPIILRTEEGAFIKFADGTSPNSPSGKFSGARMPGKVIVVREESKPGMNDGFEFETQNIQVNKKQILAVNPVRFRYGRHHGSGHNLTINLAERSKNKKNNQRQPLVRNLKTVELAHLDEIMLVPDPDEEGVGDNRNQSGLSESIKESPIRVTCTGPFRLDFGKSRMVLFDEIHVEQLHADEPHDHLYCDRLEVLFKIGPRKSTSGAVTSKVAATGDAGKDRLELRTVTAFGTPAKLVVDSKNAYAQANWLSYHLKRRIIHAKQDVVLRDGDHQFVAPEMEYKLTLNNQLGTGWATGPGQITGYPDDPEKVFRATWQSEFNIQPHEGKKAISLHGNAQIVFQNEKHFHCEELHFWIWEKRLRGPKPRWEFHPAQMLGRRQVTLNAPEFGGSVEEIRVFWPQPIGVIPRDNQLTDVGKETSGKETNGKEKNKTGKLVSHAKNASQPSAGQSTPRRGLPKKPVENRIFGRGKIATAHLTRKNELKSFRIEGGALGTNGQALPVHIQSIDLTTATQGRPPKIMLDVKGSDIHVDSTNQKDAYKVSVLGSPSVVEAEGVRFEARSLSVDQSTNFAWSHVPGNVQVSPVIQADQRPFGPQPKTTIFWNKKFEFDGSIFTLDDEVRFEGLDYLDSGEQVTFEGKTSLLKAQVNRVIDFSRSLRSASGLQGPRGNASVNQSTTQSKTPVKIREVALLKDAYLKAVTRESINEVRSVDEIQSREINIRTDTGDARALGPGNIRSVRKGKDNSSEAPNNLVAGLAGKPGGLTYLEVAFDGQIIGNVHQRKGRILDKIRAVYGPVKDWTVRYDPDATSIFGDEVYLNCDEMKFSQWTPARSAKPLIEIAAVGNTELEGKKFRALASQLTYTAENEVVQLEGLDRTNARIWFRKNDNQPWQYGEARKFRYQRSTSEIIGSEGVQEMRFLQFEAPKKRRK